MKSIAQLRHFRAFPPGVPAIAGEENIRRLGPGKFEIGNVGVIGHPADMAVAQTGAGLAPGLPAVSRAEDAIPRPCQNHAFPGDNAGHLLPFQAAPDHAPVAVTVANQQAVIGSKINHRESPFPHYGFYYPPGEFSNPCSPRIDK